jgi:hypothetical protein
MNTAEKLARQVLDSLATGDVAAAGDLVTEDFVDTLGFAPTGPPYAMPVMHLYRAEGGLLAEHWGVRDELSVLWQVGALRPPAPIPLSEV